MTEQKLINVYVDPVDAEETMAKIREAAGDDAWRIVNIAAFEGASAAKHVSPGINDPRTQEGELVLVLLERTTDDPIQSESRKLAAAAL